MMSAAEAASALTEKQAEIERLESELANANKELAGARDNIRSLLVSADAARADARVKERWARQWVSGTTPAHGEGSGYYLVWGMSQPQIATWVNGQWFINNNPVPLQHPEAVYWSEIAPPLEVVERNGGDVTFSEYEMGAWSTAMYPDKGEDLTYPVLGLAGESGEVADLAKKVIRGDITVSQARDKILAECGDAMWYLNAIAITLGSSLQSVALRNIAKLKARARAGTINQWTQRKEGE